MSTLEPPGTPMQKAVRWIDEQRELHPERPLPELVDRAGPRFNLSPKEQQMLARFYGVNSPPRSAPPPGGAR